jgi:hypothetical protein
MASAVAAGILQFERPHDRWRLYRSYQRAFEDQRLRFENQVEPYQGSTDGDRDRQLAATIGDLRAQLHQDWSGLVRASSSVANSLSTAARPRDS